MRVVLFLLVLFIITGQAVALRLAISDARAAGPVETPPLEIGADGAGGAWLTVGPDDAMLTVSSAGTISLMECGKPIIRTMGSVTVLDCGPVFSKKLAAAVLTEWRRRKP